MKNLALLKIAKQVGSQKRLAAALNMNEKFLNQIIAGRRNMPLRDCLRAEKLSQGLVKREELNPHIDWAELRSLMNE